MRLSKQKAIDAIQCGLGRPEADRLLKLVRLGYVDPITFVETALSQAAGLFDAAGESELAAARTNDGTEEESGGSSTLKGTPRSGFSIRSRYKDLVEPYLTALFFAFGREVTQDENEQLLAEDTRKKREHEAATIVILQNDKLRIADVVRGICLGCDEETQNKFDSKVTKGQGNVNYLERRCLQMLATLKHQYGKAEPPQWAPYVIHHASATVFRGGAMALLSSCDTECGRLLRKHGVKNLRKFAHAAKTTEEAIELIQKAVGPRFLRIED